VSAALPLKDRFRLSRFLQGERAGAEPVLLGHRRIFILPSKTGLGFVLLIAVLLLIAFIYNNNLAYMLSFLLASIFILTILHNYKSLAGLLVSSGKCPAVFAGDAAAFKVIIDNPGEQHRYNLRLRLAGHDARQTDIAPRQKIRITLYSVTRQRGWHSFPPVTFYNYFPLGLFRAWAPVNFNARALVYPQPADTDSIWPGSTAAASDSGAKQRGNDDFHGLQEYQAGDPIRRIHWQAYAKGQGLYSKQYSGGGKLQDIWLDYADTSDDNTEQRLSQLCRWVVDADQAGIGYGFRLPGLTLQPASGPAHYRKCLQAMALF